MTKYQDLYMVKIQEIDQSIEIIIAEAQTSEKSQPVSEKEEPNPILRDLISQAKPIIVNDSCPHYEVVFDWYISYSVTNESYANKAREEDICERFQEEWGMVYSKSAFLDYVSQATFASFDYPGPFKHYQFCCLNHIIDVVSVSPPQINRLGLK